MAAFLMGCGKVAVEPEGERLVIRLDGQPAGIYFVETIAVTRK